MADFCLQCTAVVWDGVVKPEENDMAGLCKEDEMVSVLCEHCGPIFVDWTGKCITPDCVERHGEEEKV